MRYFILGLLFLVSACANTVEIDETKEYKCGDKIVKAEFLDDDSVIIKINGNSTVLHQTASESGTRYDNSDSKMTLTRQGRDTYLSVDGTSYPLCYEIER
ncbi:MAG: MliC family protein [Alphaproteobacteria bacterium]|nr:MliC family protein [Alphaproteobacteria bacterium]